MRRHRFHLVVVALVLALLRARAESPVETSLMIGQGWAVVREVYNVRFTNENQEIVLQDVPREADLSTLSATSRRFEISLTEWRRESLVSSDYAPGADADLSFGRKADTVTWSPSRAQPPRDVSSGQVVCKLHTPHPGERNVDVVYVVTGITWRADYMVLLRGGLSNEEEKVSVDISGSLRVMNRTTRTFENARLLFVGMDKPPETARVTHGFVMVDEENALADLWKDPPEDPSTVFEYQLANPVRLAAGTETAVPLVSSARQPAERVYRLNAEDLPVAGRQQERPLRKYLVLKNDPAYGLGMALPPGDAEMFLGGMRSTLFQKAWFAHTPANGEILIDLGVAENVVGSRRDVSREDAMLGGYDITYDLIVENRLGSPVDVQIFEQPPTTLEWIIIRAKATYALRGRHIVFNTSVEGRSTQQIDYTIRVREPSI